MNESQKAEELRRRLSGWGNENIRDFPWRRTYDPYSLLVAEFMLHRTQASQVLTVYNCFLNLYPDLKTFANARADNVRQILEPLGLQWRIEAMINALFNLWEKFGKVPLYYASLVSIGGIGPYIAGATICFSLNKPLALVDTNTVRVIGRIFGMKTDAGARRRQGMVKTIKKACDIKNPRKYYYSMIDLAHSICNTSKPQCVECPLLGVPCSFGQIRTSTKKE